MISILLILWEFYLCHSNMDWIWKKLTNWYLFSLFYFKQFWLKTYFLYEKKISFLLYVCSKTSFEVNEICHARDKTLISNTEIMFIINEMSKICANVLYYGQEVFCLFWSHVCGGDWSGMSILFRIHDMFHPSFDSQVCRLNYSVAWFHNNSRWVSS